MKVESVLEAFFDKLLMQGDEGDQFATADQEDQSASAGPAPGVMGVLSELQPLHILAVTTPLALMVYLCVTQHSDKVRNKEEEKNITQLLAAGLVFGVLFFGGLLLANAVNVSSPLGQLPSVILDGVGAVLTPFRLNAVLFFLVGFLAREFALDFCGAGAGVATASAGGSPSVK